MGADGGVEIFNLKMIKDHFGEEIWEKAVEESWEHPSMNLVKIKLKHVIPHYKSNEEIELFFVSYGTNVPDEIKELFDPYEKNKGRELMSGILQWCNDSREGGKAKLARIETWT